MDLHLNKSAIILVVIALLVGGVIGGVIGFVAGHHEGRGRREFRGGQEWGRGRQMMRVPFDNQADGETDDDKGGAPNSDEYGQTAVTSSLRNTGSVTSSIQVQP